MFAGTVGVILALGFAVQLAVRNRIVRARWCARLFYLCIAGVACYAAYLTIAQGLLWKDGGGLGKFFLPPYQSLWYVVGYEFARFGLYYAISLIVALSFLAAAEYANEKSNLRFFEPGEPYLAALAIFLLGNPVWHYAWLWYIAALSGIAVLGTGFYLVAGKNRRFSLYYLWLPVAVSTIMVIEVAPYL